MWGNIMPQLLRNLFLHDQRPESRRYDYYDLLVDCWDAGFLVKTEDFLNPEAPLTFGYLGLDDDLLDVEGKYRVGENTEITRDNIKNAFIPLVMLETRRVAINGMLEGLTLADTIDLHLIFRHYPKEVVNKVLFNNPEVRMEDIFPLNPEYDIALSLHATETTNAGTFDPVANDICYSNMKLFIEDTLPSVFEILSGKSDTFLSDFVYYVTGTPYVPYLEANPNWKIKVEFSLNMTSEFLPAAATCDNCLQVPFCVYDNDKEVICKKFESAMKNGKKAGFGMN